MSLYLIQNPLYNEFSCDKTENICKIEECSLLAIAQKNITTFKITDIKNLSLKNIKRRSGGSKGRTYSYTNYDIVFKLYNGDNIRYYNEYSDKYYADKNYKKLMII